MAKHLVTQNEPTDELLLQQALARAARRVQTKPEPAPDRADPRGRVFPGNMPGPATPTTNTRVPRPGSSTRKVSPFTVVVALLLTAIAGVLYISNVIAVSRLAAEIGQLEEQYQTVLNEQEMVRAQIARLSGLERIRRIAEEQYGMHYSDAVPGWLTVEDQRIAELQHLAGTAGTRSGQ